MLETIKRCKYYSTLIIYINIWILGSIHTVFFSMLCIKYKNNIKKIIFTINFLSYFIRIVHGNWISKFIPGQLLSLQTLGLVSMAANIFSNKIK